jgi:hypothetical protein
MYVMPCVSCKNRRFRGTYRFHHQCDSNRRAKKNVSRYIVFIPCVPPLLVTASVVPSSHILVSLTMEAIFCSETSVPTRDI